MDIKEVKKLSYADIDSLISKNESQIDANISKIKPFQDEISRLESEIKTLREVKSQKIIDDSKQSIVDSKIDFSLEDFQEFLLSKKIDERKTKPTKKIRNKKNDDKNFSAQTTNKKNYPPDTFDEKNVVVQPDDFLNSPAVDDEEKIPTEGAPENFNHSDSEKLTNEEKKFLQQFRAKNQATKNSLDFQNMSAQEKEDLMPTGLPEKVLQKSQSKYVSAFDEEEV